MSLLKNALFALALLIAAALALGLAYAQDATPPPDMQKAGPYRIAVQMTSLQPVQADARYYVYLLDDVTGQAVPEAQVRIRTVNQTTGKTGFAIALSRPQEPFIYTANVSFDEDGVYDGVAEVTSTLGTETVPAPQVVVHFQSSSAVGGWAFLVTMLVLVGGGVYLTFQMRKAQRQRASAAASPMAKN